MTSNKVMRAEKGEREKKKKKKRKKKRKKSENKTKNRVKVKPNRGSITCLVDTNELQKQQQQTKKTTM